MYEEIRKEIVGDGGESFEGASDDDDVEDQTDEENEKGQFRFGMFVFSSIFNVYMKVISFYEYKKLMRSQQVFTRSFVYTPYRGYFRAERYIDDY